MILSLYSCLDIRKRRKATEQRDKKNKLVFQIPKKGVIDNRVSHNPCPSSYY